MAGERPARVSRPPRRGSTPRSRRPPPPRRAPGTAIARRPTTPWSSPRPARARRWPRSSGRSTGWPASRAPAEPQRRCRVLYVSPMKALAVDVERNLRAPLAGIRHAATRLGLPEPDLTVGVRSGDTPADERRRFGRTPPDILITTPESLFLILTSPGPRVAARRRDGDRRRGARGGRHQARRPPGARRSSGSTTCSSSRRSASGCRATVRPVEEVARFLGGAARRRGRAAAGRQDRRARGRRPGRGPAPSSARPPARSAAPRPERSVVRRSGRTSRSASSTSSQAHRSTIVFANSRRLAERLCARLNEIA